MVYGGEGNTNPIKIAVAFTRFFDTLLGLSGIGLEKGNGPLPLSCEGGPVAPKRSEGGP